MLFCVSAVFIIQLIDAFCQRINGIVTLCYWDIKKVSALTYVWDGNNLKHKIQRMFSLHVTVHGDLQKWRMMYTATTLKANYNLIPSTVDRLVCHCDVDWQPLSLAVLPARDLHLGDDLDLQRCRQRRHPATSSLPKRRWNRRNLRLQRKKNTCSGSESDSVAGQTDGGLDSLMRGTPIDLLYGVWVPYK